MKKGDKLRRPTCEKCGTPMISVCARLGNGPADTRKTSMKSYKRVGWACRSCPAIVRTPMPPSWDFPTPLL